jgi:hypothetical protein
LARVLTRKLCLKSRDIAHILSPTVIGSCFDMLELRYYYP